VAFASIAYSDAMTLSGFSAVVTALADANVRYLVVGGLAVNAHGYLRFTKDVQLIPDNIERAFAALASLGYRPAVPIDVKQFANESTRAGWIRDKNMQVLQFWSDAHRETPIDVFVSEPFDFDKEYARALVKPLYGSTDVRFVSRATLIQMKISAGRAQDHIDIDHWTALRPIARSCAQSLVDTIRRSA
jgi:hypothetical protein